MQPLTRFKAGRLALLKCSSLPTELPEDLTIYNTKLAAYINYKPVYIIIDIIIDQPRTFHYREPIKLGPRVRTTASSDAPCVATQSRDFRE